LKDKLALLERVPDAAINRAARTLLDLCESWENSTKEERKDPIHLMIQEVGVDLTLKHAVWVKVKPDYESLFSIVIGLDKDAERQNFGKGVRKGKDRRWSMKKEELKKKWQGTSEEIISGVAEWREQNPTATLREIEEEVDKRLAELRVQMIADAALASKRVQPHFVV
jgi:hypothetical protein